MQGHVKAYSPYYSELDLILQYDKNDKGPRKLFGQETSNWYFLA